MKAREVMTAPVITASPHATIKSVAETLLKYGISALPVLDESRKLVGIISEGDLLHRVEAGTERRHSWWLRGLLGPEMLAPEYVKAHARKVSDVMTRDVITASPETPLHEIAALLEKRSIKRVPIVENGQLVGIVSRANLIQAVAGVRGSLDISPSDATIRDQLLTHLNAHHVADTTLLNVTVNDGVVNLWGAVRSHGERHAIRVAAEATSGVRAVIDNMKLWPRGRGGYM